MVVFTTFLWWPSDGQSTVRVWHCLVLCVGRGKALYPHVYLLQEFCVLSGTACKAPPASWGRDTGLQGPPWRPLLEPRAGEWPLTSGRALQSF